MIKDKFLNKQISADNAQEILKKLQFNEQGLIPAIAQDCNTGKVLMLAWMNQESIIKTISIKVRFADFSTITRSKTLPLPISSTQEIYTVVKDLFKALKLDRARLRLVGVSLENLREDAPQQLMLGQREKGWREAESAIDQASARFGEKTVRPARLFRLYKKGEKE